MYNKARISLGAIFAHNQIVSREALRYEIMTYYFKLGYISRHLEIFTAISLTYRQVLPCGAIGVQIQGCLSNFLRILTQRNI